MLLLPVVGNAIVSDNKDKACCARENTERNNHDNNSAYTGIEYNKL